MRQTAGAALCALAMFLGSASRLLAAGEVRAVAIGISSYVNYNEAPLKYAHLDAIEFASTLKAHSTGD